MSFKFVDHFSKWYPYDTPQDITNAEKVKIRFMRKHNAAVCYEYKNITESKTDNAVKYEYVRFHCVTIEK